MDAEEVYSNPIAPDSVQRLTNADFRQMLMTPRAAPAKSSASKEDREKALTEKKNQPKKSFIAKHKKEEKEKQNELLSKYRDRAKERREGNNPDYKEISDSSLSVPTGYRAVGPDTSLHQLEEQRKRVIDESKYLGGDMQHTHLVKGLDYVLKQKRIEAMQAEKFTEKKKITQQKHEKDKEDEVKFSTVIGKNIYRSVFVNRPPLRNELFAPGRMAYVYDLEDEYMGGDIPTTLIRSKADCPQIEDHSLMNTNDIVINKLTQILSYLRTGVKPKKPKKRDRGKIEEEQRKGRPPEADLSIFDDAGDYKFDAKLKASAGKVKKGSYFNEPDAMDKEDEFLPPSAESIVKPLAKKFDYTVGKDSKNSDKKDDLIQAGWSEADVSLHQQLAGGGGAGGVEGEGKGKMGPEEEKGQRLIGLEGSSSLYMECYPGAMEEVDSDEEADYTKMDLGNKKGPIKRWDFENEDDYAAYQSNREALPKAAFQYGVKMHEGRKTRRSKGGGKGDMAKLNKQWQQISALLAKKKDGNSEAPQSKRSRE